MYNEEYYLEKTSSCCPEQYNVYKNNEMVGYLRLRNGVFVVKYPDVEGGLIYIAITSGDGCFDKRERTYYLNRAIEKIDERLKR